MTASDHGFAELAEVCASQVRAARSARRATESYETWFGEGAELPVLRMLGLFDRPVDEKTLGILLEPPAIRGLTASLTHLTPAEWRTILAKLRRARLLAGEDPHNPGHLDTHPLVREYFGEQLRSERTEAWKECNRRLYEYYRTLAPQLPAGIELSTRQNVATWLPRGRVLRGWARSASGSMAEGTLEVVTVRRFYAFGAFVHHKIHGASR